MDSDPLTECFMHRLAERVIEMGFPTQNQCKVVHRIIAVVHEHLDIIQDSGTQILGFINGKKQGLSFLFVEIGDLLLNGLEHAGFAAFIRNAEDGTELFVKVCHADGGQAQVFHVEQAGIQTCSKASQGIRLSHTGPGGKHTNPPDILEIVQAVCHFPKVIGYKVILLL